MCAMCAGTKLKNKKCGEEKNKTLKRGCRSLAELFERAFDLLFYVHSKTVSLMLAGNFSIAGNGSSSKNSLLIQIYYKNDLHTFDLSRLI